MNTYLRVSRVQVPRTTRWSSLLLVGAFSLFGIWVDSTLELKPAAQISASFSEQIFLQCKSHNEDSAYPPAIDSQDWTIEADSHHCAALRVSKKIC